jgi:hypothetical protein
MVWQVIVWINFSCTIAAKTAEEAEGAENVASS